MNPLFKSTLVAYLLLAGLPSWASYDSRWDGWLDHRTVDDKAVQDFKSEKKFQFYNVREPGIAFFCVQSNPDEFHGYNVSGAGKAHEYLLEPARGRSTLFEWYGVNLAVGSTREVVFERLLKEIEGKTDKWAAIEVSEPLPFFINIEPPLPPVQKQTNGVFLSINSNDSDVDGIMDLDDPEVFGHDPDMRRIMIAHPWRMPVTVTASAADVIKIYETQNKRFGNKLNGTSISYNGTDDGQFWIEGIAPGSITLTLAAPGGYSDSLKVNVIGVENTPASMNANESLDSGTFTCTVTPSGLNPTYQWLTGESKGAWPSGVGNNPELDYSAPTASSTKVKEARWFANPDDRHWLVTGSTCTYSINCEVTVNGGSCQAQSPAQLVVTADASGSTSWPQFSGVGTIQVSTRLVGTNTEWYVSGQGSFSRTAPVKTINVPATSQFYNKVDAHESKHVTQWTSESPWKDLFNATALYASTLQSLTSQISEADLRNQIDQTVALRVASDSQVAVETICDREIAAFTVDRGVEPHYQELDDNEVPGVYNCTP